MEVTTAISMLYLDVKNESVLSDILSREETVQTVFEIDRLDLGEIAEKSDIDSENGHGKSIDEGNRPQHGSVTPNTQDEIRCGERIIARLELIDPEYCNVLRERNHRVTVICQPGNCSSSSLAGFWTVGSTHDRNCCPMDFNRRCH
jgi:hypothetical protein